MVDRYAADKSKPKKPREPEEVWYDVHKHPDGVPGGMGRSPEHHLRNRGWSGHEINEGSGKKTIQYRNHNHPDFVISYGGGTSTKPDHNFRVLYMGVNHNVPKVTRAYSVAEAMNKVEELHGLNNGLVVQPMTHGANVDGRPRLHRLDSAPASQTPPSSWRDMTDDDVHPIGAPKMDFPTQPDREKDWPKRQKPQLQEIKPPPKYASLLMRAMRENWEESPSDANDYYHGTLAKDLDYVAPASQHGRGVTFPSDTDPDYAYVTRDPSIAWHYAEKAWHTQDRGRPRVYRVKATGLVEEDPHLDQHQRSRGNFTGDLRSRHPFEVQEELPMPESMGDPEDWDN